ncbi:TatD family hydrolase [Allochromatium vinosum]|uniref:Hydrolase, TatD family n=1 Tax=Allochromatium vinosum (strain ATCC 17899 / DSM 180 / NBRC 103801 / NCIMB 10441 / D) TaxID=572477 RepID=D3RTA8_ALLVD|nr:TatD family hydrolase [Allochromatium vinosum]ADC62417.1 hydrolase, TatD family [Allochromatium vinosum DSM 180]
MVIDRPATTDARLIDTHCHIDVAEFDADRAVVLARARAAGVEALVMPAIDAGGWEALLALCGSAPPDGPGLYPALGLHPVYLDSHRDADLARLETLVAERAVIAIGEIGLDHHVAGLDPERQTRLLERQLAIARAADLPVLLHVRKAHDEMLALLRRQPVPAGGIAHAFNGSLQQAHQYLELGFKLGFGGMLTFERSRKLRRLATELPLDALVLETDAPDMTVASHQGERNSPEYLPEVLEALARLRDLEPSEVAARTTANACEVLRGLR